MEALPVSMSRSCRSRAAFACLSVVFACAGLFHAWAIVSPGVDESSSSARHAAFVAINLACAWGFRRRPRGFTIAFAVLVAQQFVSHGQVLVTEWRSRGRVDAASIGVLVLMPLALALLWRSSHGRKRGAETGMNLPPRR